MALLELEMSPLTLSNSGCMKLLLNDYDYPNKRIKEIYNATFIYQFYRFNSQATQAASQAGDEIKR